MSHETQNFHQSLSFHLHSRENSYKPHIATIRTPPSITRSPKYIICFVFHANFPAWIKIHCERVVRARNEKAETFSPLLIHWMGATVAAAYPNTARRQRRFVQYNATAHTTHIAKSFLYSSHSCNSFVLPSSNVLGHERMPASHHLVTNIIHRAAIQSSSVYCMLWMPLAGLVENRQFTH